MQSDGGVDINIPLITQIGTRDGSLQKDAKMVNCYPEVTEAGNAVVKRPGLSQYKANPTGTGSGDGQGQFLVNGAPYSIYLDTIYQTNGAGSWAIPTITVALLKYEVLSDIPLGTSLLKSTAGLWKFDGTTVTKVTDANFPALTVPGISYLDGGYYVMDSLGTVHGSALQNPMIWPALNFIAADVSLGAGVRIHRHLNYIVAMYAQGTQLYYDAGNATGSPLTTVGNASWRTGCASGTSVVEIADSTFFMSVAGPRGRTVTQMEGLSLATVSTPYIEKILNLDSLSTVYSFGIRLGGHTFYALTLENTGVTLVYDTVLAHWHLWTSTVSGVEQFFVGHNYLNAGTLDLFQEEYTGAILQMSPSIYTDVSGVIAVRVVTKPYDWGSLKRKFIPAVYLIADTIASTVTIRYSDDDYTTMSAWRTFLLSTTKKMGLRFGSTRRRSWEVLHTDNTPFRAYALEVELEKGEG
jgi:hypothetical protein